MVRERKVGMPSAGFLGSLGYRLQAIAVGKVAVSHVLNWESRSPQVIPALRVTFDGKVVFRGLASGFTNPAIEAACVHSRALLDFLGLQLANATSLRTIAERRATDVGIENFAGLQKLTREDLMNAYAGEPKEDAERAFAGVMRFVNKRLAHTATDRSIGDTSHERVSLVFEGIGVLVTKHFYRPLKIDPPLLHLPARRRPKRRAV